MTRRALILMTVLLAIFTFPLTITGASIALPDIGRDLHAGLSATQLVVNGYNACFASFLVFAGSLADVLGRRRVFAAGVALYCAGGLVSMVIDDITLLNVVRALAGIGAAAAVTGGGSIITATFEGPARVRAFGLLGTVLGVGLAFGPTLGGLLVDALGWRAVFGVPAAVTAVVLLLTPLLPGVRETTGRRVDWAGAALFTVPLLLVIFALVEAPDLGFGSPPILAAFVLAAALAVAFPLVERRIADPLFDLSLLANPRFLSLAVAAGSIVVVLVPLLVYLPSYLISVVGLDAGQAGLWLLMLTAPTVLLPTVGAALAKRLPQVVLVAGSVAVTGAGAFLLVTIGPDSTVAGLLLPLALTGAGFGLSTGLLDGLAVSTVRADQLGAASGMFNAARLTSETIGIAVVGALLATLSGGRLAGTAYTAALHTVCVGLGCFAVVATGGVVWLSRRARVLSPVS